jgi:hypothetical protein|tara:strand:- start:1629 stop:1775 length:147 start_codon:yes stop_codon:yes gene_type:complete
MDSKDFKRYLAEQLKSYLFSKHSSYAVKQRQSRPRAKENIINPKMKGI